MTLVDTSVWIDHLRAGDARLARLLVDGRVVCHPFVVGEIACGTLRQRSRILSLLADLPQAPLLPHEEVLAFIDLHSLPGLGLGWVDVHLLAAAFASENLLWTRDRRLARVAVRLGIQA